MTERYDPRNTSFWDDDAEQTLTHRHRALKLLDEAEAALRGDSSMTSDGRRNQIEAANARTRIAALLLGVRYPL